MNIVHGDIWDADATIVVPVNCVGVMGAGLAKQAADRRPTLAAFWRDLCDRRRPLPGTVHAHTDDGRVFLLAATKDHWRKPSRLPWIDDICHFIGGYAASFPYETIAVPALGCGYGGLSWGDVLPLMTDHFDAIPGIVVYAPCR